MNARQTIELVLERKTPSKDWTSTTGIYANLSKWPHSVEYYVECPKCHQVHGSYKTMKEAHSQRLCSGCNLEAIDKIKDQVRQVVAEPEKKVRTLSSIVRESEFDKLPPVGPPDPVPSPDPEPEQKPDDEDAFIWDDPMGEVERMMFSIWTVVAMRDLAAHEGIDYTDLEIESREGDYDESDPNNTTYFTVSDGNTEWLIFKDDDTAYNYAVERVKQDLRDEPGIFTQSWLVQFVDEDRLKNAIGDPYEDYGDEERDLDYDDKLDKMVEEDRIESDDPVFFKKNGDKRVPNAAREKQLEEILDQWIEETKPSVDPWEYLEDIYGKEKAAEEAVKMVGIDEDKAAKDAVSSDGWQHFLARYDGNSIDLENGAVACRTN